LLLTGIRAIERRFPVFWITFQATFNYYAATRGQGFAMSQNAFSPKALAAQSANRAASRPAKSRDGGYADSGNGATAVDQTVVPLNTRKLLARQDQV